MYVVKRSGSEAVLLTVVDCSPLSKGLRGIASFVVVTGHICTSFAPTLLSPAMGENGPTTLFQLPFLRLCVGGRAAVAMFFFITGFVNSINSLKHARADNTTASLKSLSRSAFTRSGRLVFPTTAAIFVAWLFCQLGAFNFTARADADWISGGWHAPDGFRLGFRKLVRTAIVFWNTGSNEYDGTHWTLRFFLSGSFQVYLALLALTFVKRRFWYLITVSLYLYNWLIGDCKFENPPASYHIYGEGPLANVSCQQTALVGINVFAGFLLAQLHIDLGARATTIMPKAVPSMLIVIGLFFSGYPENKPEWAWWSKQMLDFGAQVTPGGTELGRYWPALGTTLLMFGIFFSQNARRILALPFFNFLGWCSLPVYLLHNTLMRTLLCWLVYGPASFHTPKFNERGELIRLTRPGPFAFFFIIPIFYAALYAVAYLWAIHVDPVCARALNGIKNAVFKDEEIENMTEKPTPLIPLSLAR
jgi:hypothetical protein